MKKGFSLFYTLVFLIIMAIVGTMIMQFSAYSTKHTARSFLDTKAELLLRSATEYAIMALQARNYQNDGKINKITIKYPGFIAKIRFHYFSTDCNATSKDCSLAHTKETNMSTLIYVSVESSNPAFHIRKTRITLQNP
jgi:type II secretory pathway pseudopilin PulG